MAESYHTNLTNVASFYAKELKLKVNKTTLKESLNENSFFPSLYSLSNTFERFDIPHQAFKIDKKNLENLTTPYIGYVKGQNTGKDFVLVISVADQEVQYMAEGKKVKKVTKDDFLSNFERIVLQAEPDEKSGEKDFWVNRRKEIVRTNKTDGYEDIGIEIGNPDAENIIIKVCNPYCGPCAEAHPVIEEIINNNKNVKLKLIFTASNDKNDTRGIVARHLLAIAEKQNGLLTQQALDDWYLAPKKDYDVFAKNTN